MRLRKVFAVVQLGVLTFPLSALGNGVVYSFESAELTIQPSFSFKVESEHHANGSDIDPQKIDLFESFDPALSYKLGFSVDSQFFSKSSRDFRFLFGAQGKITTGGEWTLRQFQEKDLTDLSSNRLEGGDVYIGLGSPLGNLKYGRLSVDSEGSIVDIGAKFYSRTDILSISGIDAHAVSYESPQLGPVAFTITKGAQTLKKGLTDDSSESLSPLYAATINYTLADFSARYVGTVTKDAFATAEGEMELAQTHRIEGKYTQGALSVGLGYQYAESNLEWADKELSPTDFVEKDQLDDTIFKTQEVIVGATYALGKFTPKGLIAYGHEAKSKGADSTTVLPSYLELGFGVDYALGDQTNLAFLFSKLGFVKNDPAVEFKWKASEAISFGLSHAF